MSRNLEFNRLQLFISFLALLLLPQVVFAAQMFFEQGRNFGYKDQFKMGILLETEEPLNAVEGKINFPADLLGLQNIEDGNSIINFWLERPNREQRTRDKEQGEIIFSGITPGGYKGSKGLIFSMTFLVKQEGAGIFKIHDARGLLNDGKGTEAKLQTFDSRFIISKKTSSIPVPISEVKDTEPPESFVPEIAKDESIFKDRWFVVFATQDKGSGIDHYEVKESRQRIFALFHKWSGAESPYVLKDQELRSYVFVKAIDKAGNERIATVEPKYPLKWYEIRWIRDIIIIVMVISVVVIFWLRKRRKMTDFSF